MREKSWEPLMYVSKWHQQSDYDYIFEDEASLM